MLGMRIMTPDTVTFINASIYRLFSQHQNQNILYLIIIMTNI